MLRFVCSLCGYEYDTETGLPEYGIPEGTEFDDLPEDFECPLCGAALDEFEIISEDED